MQLWRSCSAVPKVDIEFRVTPSQESKLIITAVWPHLTTTLYPRFHPPARLMSANEVTLLVKPGFATRLRALASFGRLPPSSSSAQPKAQCLRRLGLAVLGLMSRQCSLPVQAAAGRNPAAPRARLEADPPPPLASAAPSARCRPPPPPPCDAVDDGGAAGSKPARDARTGRAGVGSAAVMPAIPGTLATSHPIH